MIETIKIDSEFIKLQDLLKYCGMCETGGQAKYVIQNEEVKVNDEICTMRGKKLRNNDEVFYNGKKVKVVITI